MIHLKDVNGQWHVFEYSDLVHSIIAGGIKFAGMTFENILDLKKEYDKRGGIYPMTSWRIEGVFKDGRL